MLRVEFKQSPLKFDDILKVRFIDRPIHGYLAIRDKYVGDNDLCECVPRVTKSDDLNINNVER